LESQLFNVLSNIFYKARGVNLIILFSVVLICGKR